MVRLPRRAIASLTCAHRADTAARFGGAAPAACASRLPRAPAGKYKRTLARLYTLVGKTAGRATAALERGEELVALRAAHLGGPEEPLWLIAPHLPQWLKEMRTPERCGPEEPLWLIAPHLPQWLKEMRTPERCAPGCYWVEPQWQRFLWIAANELPLVDELIPFLLARSGQALDEFCRWVAPRRPLDWTLAMLDTYRCRCRRKRSCSGGSARSTIP